MHNQRFDGKACAVAYRSLKKCYTTYMERFFKGILIVLFSNLSFAEELDENRGPSEYFHQMLHASVELYVVRVDSVVNGTWANGAGDKVVVSALIEHVIKGDKKRGEKFSFKRIYDSLSENDRFPLGSLHFVSFKDIDGNILVSPQDPSSIWIFSNQFLKVALDHESETVQADQAH